MSENINLCKILKGHEGETFYSIAYGYCTLINVNTGLTYPILIKYNSSTRTDRYTEYGQITNDLDCECLLFPSKDQRDWIKWDEENNKPKVPKTWNELSKLQYYENSVEPCLWVDGELINDNISKACTALYKIHQLIEAGYGGNITREEWLNNNFKYTIISFNNEDKFCIRIRTYQALNIAFHTEEQAKEFLSYPENIQLLKDYFMIND